MGRVAGVALLCAFSFLTTGRQAVAASVELRSIYARSHTLEELLKRDVEASVFVFAKTDCPAVDLIAAHLRELYKTYATRKVAFYAIYSYAGLNIRDIARHSQHVGLPLRAFLDVDQELAKAWGVKRSATVVLVDKKGDRVYSGSVTDGERSGRTGGAYLNRALDELLRTGKVTVAFTQGNGCVLRTKAPALPKGLTFYKDILPIMQAKCQRCHRPGEVAPMSLLTYKRVVDNADTIAQVVEDRTMPPWPAESPLAIKDNAGLTDEEAQKILGWIAEDTPEGKPEDGPAPVTWPDPEKWVIGKPDLLFKSRSYTIPESGVVPYIYTRHPIGANDDIFLEALEVKPGARRVVHHMAIHEFPYSDKPLSAVDLVKIYGLEVSNNILGAYVPGIQPRILPPGHAIRIKKGMGVLIDAHYTPVGKEMTDVTQVGFKIRTTPPEREVFSRWFYRTRGRFMIPAGVDHHEMMRDDISFDRDIEILGVRPHLHARGKSFLVEKVKFAGDNGKEAAETIVALPRWDFNWQYDYMLEKPLRLAGGEAIRITGVWDNTDFNPTNPDPKTDVLFGEQTQDEMMGVLLIWRDAK